MRKGVLLTALALAVAVVGTAVAAFPQDSVKLYTGCLNSGGNITYVKEGDSPLQACSSPKQVVKLSGAYLAAENAVSHDPKVIERLGEPIAKSSDPKRQNPGELKPSGETFQFDIKGPKGTGIVSAVATAPDKTTPYKVTKITVTFADGAAIDVQPPGEQSDPFELKIESGNAK